MESERTIHEWKEATRKAITAGKEAHQHKVELQQAHTKLKSEHEQVVSLAEQLEAEKDALASAKAELDQAHTCCCASKRLSSYTAQKRKIGK